MNRQDNSMSKMTAQDLSKAMAKSDFAMLTTRPMSNNSEVDWSGDSFHFHWDSACTIADIEREPKVALSFQGSGHLLGKPLLFIATEGRAWLVRDKASLREHWHKELDRWFPDGVNTDGLILIQVHAHRAHCWDGEEDNEVPVQATRLRQKNMACGSEVLCAALACSDPRKTTCHANTGQAHLRQDGLSSLARRQCKISKAPGSLSII
jgi:general stress protein 26